MNIRLFLIGSGLVCGSYCHAQAGEFDPFFDPGDGANAEVRCVAVQADSKILIGGNFTDVDGVQRNRIARLNENGELDLTFAPGIAGNPFDITGIQIQPDGKILVGGTFQSCDGVPRINLLRLNADGSLDDSYNTGSGTNGSLIAMALQSDGKLIITGPFLQYNGVTQRRAARINGDGSLDPTFDPGLSFLQWPMAVAAQVDDKLLFGGTYTEFNLTPQGRFSRLRPDGSLDPDFVTGTAANFPVFALGIQPDGKIILGGMFTSYNGTDRGGIARVNTDGSLDPSFDPGAASGASYNAIAIQPDGKILVGSTFGLNRLNEDGSMDASFSGSYGTVTCLELQADGKVLRGGNLASGIPGIARVLTDLGSSVDLDERIGRSFAYPNPTNGRTTIMLTAGVAKVFELVDMAGRVVKTELIGAMDQLHEVDLGGLPSGCFILKICTDANEERMILVRS